MRKLNAKQVAQLEILRTAMTDAAIAYNAARAELDAFREDIADQLIASFEGRSDRWRESETGQRAEAFIDAWSEEPGDECDEEPTDYPTEPES